MKPAIFAHANQPDFDHKTGRLELPFQIDALKHSVHAIYHNPPNLPFALWQACIEELALACLVDLSTASLAKEARTLFFEPGRRARALFISAAKNLRLEVLADHGLPLKFLDVRLSGVGRVKNACPLKSPHPNRVLLLMGGGKDSLFTYHLLRRAGYDIQCFYLTEARRTWQQLRRVYSYFEKKNIQHRVYLDANRRGKVDDQYNNLYQSQFQIGQAVSASLPYALAHRCKYIVLGLERSSDYPMFSYLGKPVNHQHQKSSLYIRQLNKYLAWRFCGVVQVVSPLHGLHDMGIYARFLKTLPELVRLQSSCGGANWVSPHCGRCDKCTFLATLLAGLSGDRKLYRALFPRDPMDDPNSYHNWLSPPSSFIGLLFRCVVRLAYFFKGHFLISH